MSISVCLQQRILRTFPLRNNHHELSTLGLDVIAAHKRVVIKESHRGLLGISHRNAIYFYKVAPFGAIFSAHWWGRLGSFWVRFLHQAIFVAHALFLFVEVFFAHSTQGCASTYSSICVQFDASFWFTYQLA